MLWGPEAASSVTVRVPVGYGWVVESAVTAMVHVACGASEDPQLFVWVKAGWPEVRSLLMLMPSMVRGSVPELVNVAFIGVPAAVKESEEGESDAGPAPASRPVPVMRSEITGFAEELVTVT
jgi:hypothetical protein